MVAIHTLDRYCREAMSYVYPNDRSVQRKHQYQYIHDRTIKPEKWYLFKNAYSSSKFSVLQGISLYGNSQRKRRMLFLLKHVYSESAFARIAKGEKTKEQNSKICILTKYKLISTSIKKTRVWVWEPRWVNVELRADVGVGVSDQWVRG